MLSLFGSFLRRSSFALFASLRRHKLAAHACWDFRIWTGKMLPSHGFRWKKAPGFCEASGPVRASLVQHWVVNSQSLKAWNAFLFAVGLCPKCPCFVEIAAQRFAILHRHCLSVCLSWPQGLREHDKKQMQDKIQERQQTLHVKGRVKRKRRNPLLKRQKNQRKGFWDKQYACCPSKRDWLLWLDWAAGAWRLPALQRHQPPACHTCRSSVPPRHCHPNPNEIVEIVEHVEPAALLMPKPFVRSCWLERDRAWAWLAPCWCCWASSGLTTCYWSSGRPVSQRCSEHWQDRSARHSKGELHRSSEVGPANWLQQLDLPIHTPFRTQLLRSETEASVHTPQGVVLASWPFRGKRWHVTTPSCGLG